MKDIFRASVPGVISGLVVLFFASLIPAVRNWFIGIAAYQFTLTALVAASVALVFISIGATVTYLLLRKTIEFGRKDVMTSSLRSSEIDPILKKRISEVKGKNLNFGVLLLDINEFKKINDEYDHETGNRTLAEVVRVIDQRKDEYIFRYGGDEFLIISKVGIDKTGCWGFARRVVRDIAEHKFTGQINNPNQIDLTASCGCIVTDGEESTEQIRNRLVVALKNAKVQSKESGRENSVYLHEKE